MRAVLDVNVLVSALLSRDGVAARLIRVWRDGAFELVVSARLMEELVRTLSYPKLRRWVRTSDTSAFVDPIGSSATVADDPGTSPRIRSRDPDDDCLIALAASTRSILVTGDTDLLDLAGSIPVERPREFLGRLPPQA